MPRACASISIFQTIGMAPLTVAGMQAGRSSTPLQLVTALSVTRGDLALAILTIKASDSNTLPQRDFRPQLVPSAQTELEFSSPNASREEVYSAISEFHPTQGIERSGVRFGEQATLPRAIKANAFGLIQACASFESFQDSEVEDASVILLVYFLRQNFCADH